MTAIKLNKEVAYKTIVNKRGDPALSAIVIFEEIINQFQLEIIPNIRNPNRKDLYTPFKEGWRVSYKFFEEKLNFKYDKARDALLVLEKYDLIKRKVTPTPSKRGIKEGGSILRIVLHLENIKRLLEI